MQKKSKKKEFNVLIERDSEGFFVATVIGLPGCHTQARSLKALLSRIKEAAEAYLEAKKVEEENEFIGLQKIAV